MSLTEAMHRIAILKNPENAPGHKDSLKAKTIGARRSQNKANVDHKVGCFISVLTLDKPRFARRFVKTEIILGRNTLASRQSRWPTCHVPVTDDSDPDT